MNNIVSTFRHILYDIVPFILILCFVSVQFRLRFTRIACKYIYGHIANFASSFVGIYLGVNMYFDYISNCIPEGFVNTGIPLAIYLIFIGVLIDIIHKYFDKKNKYYTISKSERIFIMCTCIVTLCIIEYFSGSTHMFEIIAILLGKFFWIDTGISQSDVGVSQHKKKILVN